MRLAGDTHKTEQNKTKQPIHVAGYQKQRAYLWSDEFIPRSFTFCLEHGIRLHVKKI